MNELINLRTTLGSLAAGLYILFSALGDKVMNTNTLKYLLKDPMRIIPMMGSKGLLNWMPDKLYLQIAMSHSLGYKININNPHTYNEKLQWLKIYDRKPLYTQLVDKYAVREYIAEKIGEEYLIPLVGGPWDSVDEIDFDSLPERFVLKTTHDSGGVIICRDKQSFDVDTAKQKLNKRLGKNYFWSGREWPYKNVKPRVIAEKYMIDDNCAELRDYKFYCFGGQVKVMLVVTDRMEKEVPTKFTFFDMEFNKLPFEQAGPSDTRELMKPLAFDDMRGLAEKLSAGFPQIRVDLYDINGKIYFGELTFFDSSGGEHFEPHEWDEIMGSWIELPEKTV